MSYRRLRYVRFLLKLIFGLLLIGSAFYIAGLYLRPAHPCALGDQFCDQ